MLEYVKMIQTDNTSALLQSALATIHTNNTAVPLYNTNTTNSSYITTNSSSESGIAKLVPSFKLEMYKAENGGFVLNLLKAHPLKQFATGKLFILKDIENLGKDIQYILATEVLKDC
jgi:hypothetical protein